MISSNYKILDLSLNMFSKGNLLSSLESNSGRFSGLTNTEELSTGCDAIWEVGDIDDEDDDEDTEGKSALGRKTMTVLPTVVTNSSNPKTVLVIIPENCDNFSPTFM